MDIYRSSLNKVLSGVRRTEHSGLLRCGRISSAVGLTIEAKGFNQPIGQRVQSAYRSPMSGYG